METKSPQPTEQASSKSPPPQIGAMVGFVVLALVAFTFGKYSVTTKPREAEKSPETLARQEIEATRQAILAEMRINNPMIWFEKAQALKYGSSETWARIVFGEPFREMRDGQGGHLYMWVGSGVVLNAGFRSGKCFEFQILDELDVEAWEFIYIP